MDEGTEEGQKMIGKSLLFLSIVMAILTTSCGKSIATKSKILWEELSVKITLNSFKNSSFPDSKKPLALVYGSLEIRGMKKAIKTVDLDCIVLDIGGSKSEKIYVDSVAHILTSEYRADNNVISVDVYWKFDKLLLPNAFKTFNYEVRFPEKQKCVSFQEANSSQNNLVKKK